MALDDHPVYSLQDLRNRTLSYHRPSSGSLSQLNDSAFLFSRLLTNREAVYDHTSTVGLACASTETPVLAGLDTSALHSPEGYAQGEDTLSDSGYHHQQESEHEDQDHMLARLQTFNNMVTMSPAKRPSTKQALTERKTRRGVAVKKGKRAASSSSRTPTRQTKRAKVELKNQKKLDVKNQVDTSTDEDVEPPAQEVIVISSDDEDDEPLINRIRSKNHIALERIRAATKSTSPLPKIDNEDNEWPFYPLPRTASLSPHTPFAVIEIEKKDLELEQLRTELANAKADTERIRRSLEADLKNQALELEKSKETFAKEQSKLHQALEAEQQELRNVTRERDNLRVEVADRTTAFDDLHRSHQALVAQHEQSKKEHAEVLADMLKQEENASSASSTSTNHTTNLHPPPSDGPPAFLKHQNAYPPSPASQSPCTFRSTLSPAPSHTLHEDTTKAENLRNMYSKVKRRYDQLHAAAMHIKDCTRSMDLSNFGEFGKYVKQLRGVLEADGQSRRTEDAG